MPFTLTMPKLSPTMETGIIVKWSVKEGEHVEEGQTLFEVATDKATVEYAALDEGWLRKILITEGREAIVNQALAVFTIDKEESIEGYQPEGVLPRPKEEIASVSDTASVEGSSQASIAPQLIPQAAFVPEAPRDDYVFRTKVTEKRVHASPLARKLAKDRKLDLSTAKGTGPNGRIESSDLASAQPEGPVVFGRVEHPALPSGTYEEEALSPMRKVIAQRLQQAKIAIPHFYVTQEVDAAPLVVVRDQLKLMGVHVTFNDLIVRACALALRQHPEINSGFHGVNGTVIRFKTVDIAVAVTVEGGLLTPVLRYADYKSIGEISVEVKSLAERARSGKLAPEDYKGGSFTISNLGMFGVSHFVAVINPPQACILAVSGILDRAVVKDGQVVPGKVLPLTLSADHRVVDGAAAARFLGTVQRYLESPTILIVS